MALVREPGLLVVALRFAPPGWWRRWPPLPVPPPAYRRFRLVTAYGDGATVPPVEDLVTFLRWARRQP